MLKRIFEEITSFGGLVFYTVFSFWFLFTGLINYFIILIMGLILIYTIALVIRLFYFKPRPKKMKYQNFLGKMDASSFPSVHATRSAFLFIFLAQLYKSNLILIFSMTALMALVLYSRIYLKKHDGIDLVAGFILGILLALLLII